MFVLPSAPIPFPGPPDSCCTRHVPGTRNPRKNLAPTSDAWTPLPHKSRCLPRHTSPSTALRPYPPSVSLSVHSCFPLSLSWKKTSVSFRPSSTQAWQNRRLFCRPDEIETVLGSGLVPAGYL